MGERRGGGRSPKEDSAKPSPCASAGRIPPRACPSPSWEEEEDDAEDNEDDNTSAADDANAAAADDDDDDEDDDVAIDGDDDAVLLTNAPTLSIR